MGLSPRDVDQMTLWEFNACVEGWNQAHDPDSVPPPMSGERFDELVAQYG